MLILCGDKIYFLLVLFFLLGRAVVFNSVLYEMRFSRTDSGNTKALLCIAGL